VSAFASVLVANRGEIVVRVCRTLVARGLRAVAVYAPEDAGALHVRCADVAVAVDGYLDVDGMVAAAKATGAEAIHPGYGFLSEDPAFARAVVGAGLVWIGPPAEAIELMGDKIRAKETVRAAGVPVVPGAGAPGMSDAELADAAVEIGLPALIKPAAGGGGKGMRKVADPADLPHAIAAARREAAGAFGDDTLLVERWVTRPRHVEVQVFADHAGSVVHLGERECSLQRRHQKIVEESPSPLLDDGTRRAMTQSAVDVARSCGYVGAGTVEFIVSGDRPDEYFFMEMNTRLQVEHPVTEAVTGIDLVDWQLRVAAREPVPLSQAEIRWSGHAVEARVYAEDPRRGFLPAAGTVAVVIEPEGRPGIRVDSALAAGTVVGTRFDPMLAKIVAWGDSRSQALARLQGALEATAVLGVTTNVGYLARLVAHGDVVAGNLDTELVDRTLAHLVAAEPGADEAATVAAACRLAAGLDPAGAVVDPWDVPDGWRVGGTVATVFRLRHDGEPVTVALSGRLGAGATVRVDGRAGTAVAARLSGEVLTLETGGTTQRWHSTVVGSDVWVGREGRAWRFAIDRAARGDAGGPVSQAGPVTSPMPGVVVAVHVDVGDRVVAGQPLLAVEAMKMEHTVVAPADGVVAGIRVRPGQVVGLEEVLAVVSPGERRGAARSRVPADDGDEDEVEV
jgi:acetyl-CoA/propionyl-CoA carboxylase, biotin carboxylase, biotin carboxyl carrier protein